jgi:hypothetical protein
MRQHHVAKRGRVAAQPVTVEQRAADPTLDPL